MTGDDVEVREYERLSPLLPDTRPMRDWDEVEPGDCVVAFSRKKLFQLKNEIETAVKVREIVLRYASRTVTGVLGQLP